MSAIESAPGRLRRAWALFKLAFTGPKAPRPCHPDVVLAEHEDRALLAGQIAVLISRGREEGESSIRTAWAIINLIERRR